MACSSNHQGPFQGQPPLPPQTPPYLMDVSVSPPVSKRPISPIPEQDTQLFEEWHTQFKKAKLKPRSPPAATTVQNRFANLPEEADQVTAPKPRSKPKATPAKPTSPNPTPTAPPAPKPVLPPPLVFDSHEYSTTTLANSIRHLGISEFKIRRVRKNIKINFQLQNDYNAATKFFAKALETDNPISFHTYAPAGTKPNKKFLILGLDKDESLEIITEALTHRDLIDVRRLTTMRDGQRFETANVLATFKPVYDPSTHLAQIKAINHVCFKFKPFTNNRAQPSCGRCQAIGHTKRYCYRPIICANCGVNHPDGNCPPGSKPHCANCGGEHIASYRQCPARIRLLQAKAVKSQPRPTTRYPPPPPENAWANTPAARLLYPTLPGTSPQVQLPQPPASPTPDWANQLTQTLTGILNAFMTTIQNFFATIPQMLQQK